MMELYLLYGESFVASTSDFWWDRVRKQSFGACILNFMAKRYTLLNGMSLFMSDTTLASFSSKDHPRGWTSVLRSPAPTLSRCQAIGDMVIFDTEHSGAEVGAWLDDAHRGVGCKPSYVGSHTVDGDSTAGKSVEILKWRTKDDRATQITSSKCDAHQANTSGKRAAGTSAHKVNLNKSLGTRLTLLHTNLVRTSSSGKRMGIVQNVQKEHHRTKTVIIDDACKTRWGSEHEEARRASINQKDLEVSFNRMINPTGMDK